MKLSEKIKVSVFIATSLDGYIARPDGDVSWLEDIEPLEDGNDAGYGAFFGAIGVLVMGRGSFEKVLTFEPWPYGDKPVIVLSKSLSEVPEALRKTVRIEALPPQALLEKLSQEGYKHVYLDGGKVIFRYKDYRQKGVKKSMALAGVEFLRRFCLHILPPKFQRIRHYGTLSNFHKARALAAARASLGAEPAAAGPKPSRSERTKALLENWIGRPLTDCPDCGAVDSLIRILLPPNARAPPPDFVYVPGK